MILPMDMMMDMNGGVSAARDSNGVEIKVGDTVMMPVIINDEIHNDHMWLVIGIRKHNDYFVVKIKSNIMGKEVNTEKNSRLVTVVE